MSSFEEEELEVTLLDFLSAAMCGEIDVANKATIRTVDNSAKTNNK
jgi:hypothetical protein